MNIPFSNSNVQMGLQNLDSELWTGLDHELHELCELTAFFLQTDVITSLSYLSVA